MKKKEKKVGGGGGRRRKNRKNKQKTYAPAGFVSFIQCPYTLVFELFGVQETEANGEGVCVCVWDVRARVMEEGTAQHTQKLSSYYKAYLKVINMSSF